MFDRWKETRALKAHATALATWKSERDAQAELLELAEDFEGVDSDEIMLKSGERLFLQVSDVALIEDRVRGGHYEGRSKGVSVPIGSIGGRSVRYHVGAQKGHYVSGAPTPTSIDTGTVYITNQRVIFAGSKQTRECVFTKLIGVQHDGDSTTFAVSNRQKPTTIFYGASVSSAFDFRLELALAHFKGDETGIVAQLKSDLDALDAERPSDPALPSGT